MQAVALQINVDHFVLFDEGGIRKHGKHDDFAIPKGTWTLSDSQSFEPCTAFQYSEGHLLHTSSPAQDRWKEWVKQLSAKVYVMDVWSLEEFRTLLYVLVFSTLVSTDMIYAAPFPTAMIFRGARFSFSDTGRISGASSIFSRTRRRKLYMNRLSSLGPAKLQRIS